MLVVDPVTLRKTYVEDKTSCVPVSFLVKDSPYRMWNLIPMRRHFLGVNWDRWFHSPHEPDVHASFFFLGADKYGRDIFSRIVYGSRVSLSVGLIGIAMTFIFGMAIGGVSGYVGGRVDNVIQRIIEVVNSFPSLPLWIALGAVLPADWSPVRVYFAITLVLAALDGQAWRESCAVRFSRFAKRITRWPPDCSGRATSEFFSAISCRDSPATSSFRSAWPYPR